MTFVDEIECTDCDGEGIVEHPHLSCSAGITDECPPDPVMVDCEACLGTGWREMTDDECDEAAERLHEESLSEPPVTLDEQHRAAWQQHQDLHS